MITKKSQEDRSKKRIPILREWIRCVRMGQSTTEYLLVTLLASVFVFILAVQMSPPLKGMLDRLEDVVAAKIAGGKLVTHVKVAELSTSGEIERGGTESPGISAVSPSEEGGKEEARGGSPEETGGAFVGGGERGSVSFLEAGRGDMSQKKQPSAEEGGETDEWGEGAGILPQKKGDVISLAESERKVLQKDEKKEGLEERSKGVMYGEGDEEALLKGKGFDWFRIVMILLIVLLMAYISFEIFKAIKLKRGSK